MQFTLTTQINATPKDIYTAWLSSEGHSQMTGGAAVISDKIGDDFTAWDGYIEGKNLELEPHKRIVQSWRTSEFEANEKDSRLEILLHEKDGKTELTLIHTEVPENGAQYIEGWENHYFQLLNSIIQEMSKWLISL